MTRFEDDGIYTTEEVLKRSGGPGRSTSPCSKAGLIRSKLDGKRRRLYRGRWVMPTWTAPVMNRRTRWTITE